MTQQPPRDEIQAIRKVELFDRPIDLCRHDDFERRLGEIGRSGPHSVYFCNVHMLMASQRDRGLARAMDDADFVFADGVPVAWLQKRLSGGKARVVRGYEAMLFLCAKAAGDGKRVGLLGASDGLLEALKAHLTGRFPGLDVAFLHAPPFVDGELVSDAGLLASINEAGLDYLFVGLGCPKQEKWIHSYAGNLNCSLLGVGAAFEWLAGIEPMPPRWMERSGLGWLHRLVRHPARLWKRYLIYNSAFMLSAARLLLLRRRGGGQQGGSA